MGTLLSGWTDRKSFFSHLTKDWQPERRLYFKLNRDMNKTVFKYPIPIEDAFAIDLPASANVLTVQSDEKDGKPCIWCLINPDEPECIERRFRLAGTGHSIQWPEKPWTIQEPVNTPRYIGTFQLHRGEFVGHLFELP